MSYEELSKVYYRSKDSDRTEAVKRELANRLNAPSSFLLDLQTEQGQLFIAAPREMTTLLDRVLRSERRITSLIEQLPRIARDAILRSLVLDEVVSSNAIENIHSTRKQIEDALRSSSTTHKGQQFREFARLYLNMAFSSPVPPRTPQDIRDIYDQIMDGEELDDLPDGKLFRKDIVYINDGMKQIHAGLHPEEQIIAAMEKMLELAYSDELPSVYAALATHYIFEYAHPFYDGNGRTGRYLLSLFLERSLSKPTALSLSRAIANNKNAYYKAFKTVENPLNHGELTFFIMTMLELIAKAQTELAGRLERGIERFDQLLASCEQVKENLGYSDKETNLVFALAQQAEFGMFEDTPLDMLANMLGLGTQQTRKYLDKLMDKAAVRKVSKRNPLTFALTDEFAANHFGITVGEHETL